MVGTTLGIMTGTGASVAIMAGMTLGITITGGIADYILTILDTILILADLVTNQIGAWITITSSTVKEEKRRHIEESTLQVAEEMLPLVEAPLQIDVQSLEMDTQQPLTEGAQQMEILA